MCHFVSWVEKDSKVYFLTGEKVYKTRKGKELQKHSGNIEDDKLGHGAIRFYYQLEGGQDKECSDFTNTSNFPASIVTAIKNGRMRGMVAEVHSLLTTTAWEACRETKASAWKAYQKTTAPACQAYEEIRASAHQTYQKAIASAWKAYQKTETPTWKAYEEIKAPIWKAYEETEATACQSYEEIKASACQAYEETIDTAFWDLFTDPNNRVEAWR